LINAVYADRFFYDLRAFTLEQQAEHVIFNPDEFNTAYSAIIKKLGENDKYAAQFKAIFGKGKITREKFSKALASYVLSLRSFNSSFDKYVRGESDELSQEVKNGFNLFMGKANCATCHFAPTFAGLVPPLFNENESEILGVLADPNAKQPRLDTDEGRWSNTILSEYAWIYEKSFKTNTVRNAGLTAPYFHNGAYSTLEEVIDFYNNGGGGGIGLNVINQTLATDALGLTPKEKQELIAFINALNDVPVSK
jgi:cytochrome c peroxidase